MKDDVLTPCMRLLGHECTNLGELLSLAMDKRWMPMMIIMMMMMCYDATSVTPLDPISLQVCSYGTYVD